MLPEEILAYPPKILSQTQRKAYFDTGYLLLEALIDNDWMGRLLGAMDEMVEESRGVTQSDGKFDIEPDHTAAQPRLRRLSNPPHHHRVFQEFSHEGPVVDIAEDLLGPSVCLHHSKLNFKWAHGGEEVKWHQDIQYWPHTDFSPLTIGIYLTDVDEEMGPMGVVPGSHKHELFDLYDHQGSWAGAIRKEDVSRAHPEDAIYLKGPAGSVTVHNCCSVHGSMPNGSGRVRPLLLQTYAAGDSYPLLGVGTNGAAGKMNHLMVRGERQRWMQVDNRRMPVAPDWFQGKYISIFEVQQSK